MVNEYEKILDQINNMRNADFSVEFVKDMPVYILKTDKYLLSHNCENKKERIVLESIFCFAHHLHMTIIAEDVESKEQLAFLRTCDFGKIQGYIFAKPMPATDYIALCKKIHSVLQTC